MKMTFKKKMWIAALVAFGVASVMSTVQSAKAEVISPTAPPPRRR